MKQTNVFASGKSIFEIHSGELHSCETYGLTWTFLFCAKTLQRRENVNLRH